MVPDSTPPPLGTPEPQSITTLPKTRWRPRNYRAVVLLSLIGSQGLHVHSRLSSIASLLQSARETRIRAVLAISCEFAAAASKPEALRTRSEIFGSANGFRTRNLLVNPRRHPASVRDLDTSESA